MKKEIIYIFSILLMMFLVVGCGSDSSSNNESVIEQPDNNESNETTQTPSTIEMESNTTYEVYSGDTLTTSSASEIIVDHEYGNDFKTITLVSGSASITRK